MKPPGVNVKVTTEVGYCPFCQRSRNLRREERHMGGLVRTTIECESCHRVLSSTMGPPPATPAPPAVDVVEPEPETKAAPARKRPAARKKAATTKPKKAATTKPRKASTTRKPKA